MIAWRVVFFNILGILLAGVLLPVDGVFAQTTSTTCIVSAGCTPCQAPYGTNCNYFTCDSASGPNSVNGIPVTLFDTSTCQGVGKTVDTLPYTDLVATDASIQNLPNTTTGNYVCTPHTETCPNPTDVCYSGACCTPNNSCQASTCTISTCTDSCGVVWPGTVTCACQEQYTIATVAYNPTVNYTAQNDQSYAWCYSTPLAGVVDESYPNCTDPVPTLGATCTLNNETANCGLISPSGPADACGGFTTSGPGVCTSGMNVADCQADCGVGTYWNGSACACQCAAGAPATAGTVSNGGNSEYGTGTLWTCPCNPGYIMDYTLNSGNGACRACVTTCPLGEDGAVVTCC